MNIITGSVLLTKISLYVFSESTDFMLDYEVREYLSGHRHSRGLDTSYDRLTPNERLQEWSKAINFLTIDESLYLQKSPQV